MLTREPHRFCVSNGGIVDVIVVSWWRNSVRGVHWLVAALNGIQLCIVQSL